MRGIWIGKLINDAVVSESYGNSVVHFDIETVEYTCDRVVHDIKHIVSIMDNDIVKAFGSDDNFEGMSKLKAGDVVAIHGEKGDVSITPNPVNGVVFLWLTESPAYYPVSHRIS